MSAFKGTPGPWEVVENPDSCGGDTAISNAASIYSECETYVADVYRGYVGSESVTHDQQIANARLIAAAPELLEALRVITEYNAEMSGDVSLLDRDDLWQKAEAAIAKATGEQP